MKTLTCAVKNLYPAPAVCTSGNKKRQDCYCVGGAFIMYVIGQDLTKAHQDHRFPRQEQLADLLIERNPRLTPADAMNFSQLVTTCNDQGMFDKAWWYLDRALSVGGAS